MRTIDGDALKIALDTFATLVGFGGVYDRGQVMECIDAAPTIGGWISIKDRIPDKNKEVIMCYEWTGKFSGNKYQEVIIDTLANLNHECRLIAWMPLPEPPKEENA